MQQTFAVAALIIGQRPVAMEIVGCMQTDFESELEICQMFSVSFLLIVLLAWKPSSSRETAILRAGICGHQAERRVYLRG